eukprot:scaffold3921_cov245-Skeletonema_marinoi.AAC.1
MRGSELARCIRSGLFVDLSRPERAVDRVDCHVACSGTGKQMGSLRRRSLAGRKRDCLSEQRSEILALPVRVVGYIDILATLEEAPFCKEGLRGARSSPLEVEGDMCQTPAP